MQPHEFYLGTHLPNWLETLDVPLFISHRRLRDRRSLPRARGPWALDSGGFTELSMHGRWETTADDYLEAVDRYQQIGRLRWAAPMDWMCEPFMVERTGLSVREHQERTVSNLLDLRARSPHRFIPVLQGWEPEDYERCCDLYEQAGIHLADEPAVGLGSVCRRQNEAAFGRVLWQLVERGLRLHGFGVKLTGLRRYHEHLHSADSLAWSFNARKNPPLPGCTHKSCANCPRWAVRWRENAVATLGWQTLWGAAA